MKRPSYVCLLLLVSSGYLFTVQAKSETIQTEKATPNPRLEAAKKAAQEFLEQEQKKKQPQSVSSPVKDLKTDVGLIAAPQASPQLSVKDSPTADLVESNKDKKEKSDITSLPEPPSILSDTTTLAQYQSALREHYQYRVSGYKHRQRVFEWQLFSSKIIFVVVIILVLAGIYFSWVQFAASIKYSAKTKSREGQEMNEAEPVRFEATQFEASASGIKVSSSILGVIILIISFLFFYLYLVHVYPISEII